MNIHPIIRQIVNRCHVSKSNLSVIRYTISKLQNGYGTFKAMPKNDRKMMMKQVIRVHSENGNLYANIVAAKFLQ